MNITDGQAIDNGIVHIYGQYTHHTDAFILGDEKGLLTLKSAIVTALTSPNKKGIVDVFCNDGEGYTIGIKLVKDTNILPVPYEAYYAQDKVGTDPGDIFNKD